MLSVSFELTPRDRETLHTNGVKPSQFGAVWNALMEQFSVTDARLVNVKRMIGMTMWRMKGTCPKHRYAHSNHWCLIQFDNNEAYCVFKCMKDGVLHKITFLPLDVSTYQEYSAERFYVHGLRWTDYDY